MSTLKANGLAYSLLAFAALGRRTKLLTPGFAAVLGIKHE